MRSQSGLKAKGPGLRSDRSNRSNPSTRRISLAAEFRELRQKLEFLEGLGQLIIRCGNSLDLMLDGVVRMLPAVWRYPEACSSRAVFRGTSYTAPDWCESEWMLSSDIYVQGQPEGTIRVVYRSLDANTDEDPFTREERGLLSFVATLLGRTAERLDSLQQLHEAVRQLDAERSALQQANATLHGILDRIEEERKAIRRSIATNVDKTVMPIVHALEAQAPPHERTLVSLLKKNLEEIASPFVSNLSRAFASLTPLEISICRMVRDNLSTKEIARIRHVSPSTVARQREQIRRKLGISGSDANLATYLRTFLTGTDSTPPGD